MSSALPGAGLFSSATVLFAFSVDLSARLSTFVLMLG